MSVRPPQKKERPASAGEMLALARAFLERKGCAEARLDAELLVAHALGLDRLKLFMALDRPVDEEEVTRARELCVRRGQHEPVAYLTGKREFYGRPFAVGPGVLIPRPETELLVDLARERAAGREDVRVADVGTGSGCLAHTLALELGAGARVLGFELQPEALAFARKNGEALGSGAELFEGEGLRLLAEHAREQPFDLVVSNPPYVEEGERPSLAPEVRDHEPAAALFAPAGDPDYFARRLMELAATVLAPGGVLLVELGANQAARLRATAERVGVRPQLHRDLAGIERVLELRAS